MSHASTALRLHENPASYMREITFLPRIGITAQHVRLEGSVIVSYNIDKGIVTSVFSVGEDYRSLGIHSHLLPPDFIECEDGMEEAFLEREKERDLYNIVASLPRRDRSIALHSFVIFGAKPMGNKEIAEILGCTPNTVVNRKSHYGENKGDLDGVDLLMGLNKIKKYSYIGFKY